MKGILLVMVSFVLPIILYASLTLSKNIVCPLELEHLQGPSSNELLVTQRISPRNQWPMGQKTQSLEYILHNAASSRK